LTEYERSFGFTGISRTGSKNFNNTFGHVMMDIYNLSNNFTKNSLLIDGYNETTYFECKNKFNTMKQSMAYDEIKPKLEHAINAGKNFTLLVLNDDDKNSSGRIIKLHKGYGLSKLENIHGYDENRMLWVSGDEIYKLLFPKFHIEVKNIILLLLEKLRNF
jgi:hypothetical protein